MGNRNEVQHVCVAFENEWLLIGNCSVERFLIGLPLNVPHKKKNILLTSAEFLRRDEWSFNITVKSVRGNQYFLLRNSSLGGVGGWGSSLKWQADIQLQMLTRQRCMPHPEHWDRKERQSAVPAAWQKAPNVVWCDYESQKSRDCTHSETLAGLCCNQMIHRIHKGFAWRSGFST